MGISMNSRLVRPKTVFLSLVFILFSAFAACPAKAAMVFCNRTQNPIEAALGYREIVDWVSEGWWRIEPGQCARVFGKPLAQRFYLYYATSLAPVETGKTAMSWGGKYQLCVDTKAFRVEGDEDCDMRGYRIRGFQQLDIGLSTRDYTLDFHENDAAH
jgi:uncharacterized membrane protein